MIWEYLSPSFDASSAGAHNPFTSLTASYFLIFWLAVQLVLMSLQSYYGPRFFVPKKWLPTRYDYHRPLPIHLPPVKDSASIVVQADSEFGDIETGSLLPGESGLECVICYNTIYLNVSHNYMVINKILLFSLWFLCLFVIGNVDHPLRPHVSRALLETVDGGEVRVSCVQIVPPPSWGWFRLESVWLVLS
jgi:hypothetical protein